MGPALGDGGGEGAAGHAEKCFNWPWLFRHQCPDPLGCCHRARLFGPELADIPAGARPWRQCRKGERGTTVVYADRFTPENERRRSEEIGDAPGTIAFLKRFAVFNSDQCERLPEDIATAAPPPPPKLIEPAVEALIAATRADFRIGGQRAFYNLGEDFVQVPPPLAYFEPVNWHRTALHKLGHWSGDASRLGRDMSGTHGTKKYAQEELIAEITAAFACATLGIVPTVRHADYIASWLEVLREDDRAIVRAASAASKAADYLLGCRLDHDKDDDSRYFSNMIQSDD